MLLTLEALPSAEGDCLLLHWGSADKPYIALIDGGPGRIYEEHLRPRLEEIHANLSDTQLSDGQLALDLVMISHMDNDHIIGIKKLFRTLRREIENHKPKNQRPFRIKRLWHNVFNDILGDSIDSYYQTFTASFQASSGGKPDPATVARLAAAFQQRQGDNEHDAAHNAWDISLILAGHGEGREVRDDHKYLYDKQQTAAINHPFQDSHGQPTLITLEKTPSPVTIAGLKFTVAGPMRTEIDALQIEFDKYIKDKGLSADSVLAAYADTSAKNLSSIVCLVEHEGKSILLTGDARGDKIIEGLKNAGLLAADDTLHVNILKGPHHGSDRNVAPGFFETITADTYVFSGDGKHGNPDRDTLDWIVRARGKDAEFQIVLTYSVKEIDDLREQDFAKKGKTWVKQRDAISTYLTKCEADGCKFTVQAGAPFKIELGDESADW